MDATPIRKLAALRLAGGEAPLDALRAVHYSRFVVRSHRYTLAVAAEKRMCLLRPERGRLVYVDSAVDSPCAVPDADAVRLDGENLVIVGPNTSLLLGSLLDATEVLLSRPDEEEDAIVPASFFVANRPFGAGEAREALGDLRLRAPHRAPLLRATDSDGWCDAELFELPLARCFSGSLLAGGGVLLALALVAWHRLGVVGARAGGARRKRKRHRASESALTERVRRTAFILTQVNHYFETQTVARDAALLRQMTAEGWVSLSWMVQFPRLRSARVSVDEVSALARELTTAEVEISGERIRPRSWRCFCRA